MKIISSLYANSLCLCATAFIIFVSSCGHVLMEDDCHPNDLSVTKATSGVYDESSYYVTLEDIGCYIKKTHGADGWDRGLAVKGIDPVIGSTGVTSYIINYDHGCEVVSADKRLPAIIAFSGKENLDVLSMPEPAREWLDDLNKSVDDFRLSASDFLSESEQINLSFWRTVSAQYTEDPFDPPAIPGDYPPGHWVLVDTSHELIDAVVVDHLVPVKWGQGDPYNVYCPYVHPVYAPSIHAPAGCVAVAGAQLLYYLHTIWSVPSTAPTSGYVSGYANPNNNYTQIFSNESTSAWNLMQSETNAVALLIGSVGKAVGTRYAEDIVLQIGQYSSSQSIAGDASFPTYIRNAYNISWSVGTMSTSGDIVTVSNSINGGMPVYACAHPADGSVGHAFLIDAWKDVRHKYVNEYEYVCDDPIIDEMLNLPHYIRVSCSQPAGSYFSMNWGYAGLYDSLWLAPLGQWAPDGTSYDGTRTIYYGFNVE